MRQTNDVGDDLQVEFVDYARGVMKFTMAYNVRPQEHVSCLLDANVKGFRDNQRLEKFQCSGLDSSGRVIAFGAQPGAVDVAPFVKGTTAYETRAANTPQPNPAD